MTQLVSAWALVRVVPSRLFRAARAYALISGRHYLVPDDVRRLVVPCLAHRLLPAGATAATLDAHDQSAILLERIMEETEAPV